LKFEVLAQLVDAYSAARAPGPSPEPSASADVDALEQTLAALWARGHAAHPQLDVEDVVFAAHLGRCGAPIDAGATGIHAEDLFLCCAGLLGDEAAVRTLRADHRPVLVGYLRHVDTSSAFIDEVEQRLWDSALVGSVDAQPKLATYSGKGPLAGWLGVAAQRIALMMKRHEGAGERAADAAGAEARLVAADPELAFIKGHLRGTFQRAISQALLVLGDRERMVYRMHIIDGLTVERIAKTYGVSHSTVSRWMAAARASIVAEAQRLLRDEMQASPDDYESMSRLLVSQLDLSVSRLLRKLP
jgi:RNA polymerase sigma-70 factor (ECF subfamily)